MTRYRVIRDRFLKDDVSVRLGNLAANLARVESFSNHSDHGDAVERLLEESKLFIEWTARDAESDIQFELAELQRQLVRWQNSWTELWLDSSRRADVAEKATVYSRRLLALSGLLP